MVHLFLKSKWELLYSIKINNSGNEDIGECNYGNTSNQYLIFTIRGREVREKYIVELKTVNTLYS